MTEKRLQEIFDLALAKVSDSSIAFAKDLVKLLDPAKIDIKSYLLGWSTNEAVTILNVLMEQDKLDYMEYQRLGDLPFRLSTVIAERLARETKHANLFKRLDSYNRPPLN